MMPFEEWNSRLIMGARRHIPFAKAGVDRHPQPLQSQRALRLFLVALSTAKPLRALLQSYQAVPRHRHALRQVCWQLSRCRQTRLRETLVSAAM